jgi:hypothetical protein
MAEAALEWKRSNEEAETVLRGVDPSRRVEVRYEVLCAQPDATLQGLFAFLGVEPRRALADLRTAEHHVIGNGMRLDATGEIHLDERWRSVLTPTDLRRFEAVAGTINRRLGYQ